MGNGEDRDRGCVEWSASSGVCTHKKELIEEKCSRDSFLFACCSKDYKRGGISIYSTFYTVVLFCDNFTLIFDASAVNLPSEARQIELTSIEN